MTFQFDSNGLVGVRYANGNADRWDGSELVALSEDAQEYAAQRQERKPTRKRRANVSHRRATPRCAFRVGDRVQTHPATDAWMRGDRYGDVVRCSRGKVTVRMDRSGRTLRFAEHNLTLVD